MLNEKYFENLYPMLILQHNADPLPWPFPQHSVIQSLIIYSVSIDLLILDTSSRWNHTVGGLWVWLLSLHVVIVHPYGIYTSTLFFSFSWINNIPLCGYRTFVSLSVGWCKFVLFPHFYYYEQYCCADLCTSFPGRLWFQFSQIDT